MIASFALIYFLPLQVKSLVFDQSGTYLAVGGSDIRVYICKQWSEVLNFTGEDENLIMHFILLSVSHSLCRVFCFYYLFIYVFIYLCF